MAQVPMIEGNEPELAELANKIRSGRGGALIDVYKLLLPS